MPTFVGDPPAPGTTSGDTTTPPSSPPPLDVPTDYEFTGDEIGELQTFIDGKPNGATIGLEEDAEIEGDASDQLHLAARNGLTIVARNASLIRTAQGTTPILLADGGFTGLRVYDLTIEGANPDPGKWDVDYEHEAAFYVGGGINVEFSGCGVLNVGGDGLYVTGGNNQWSKNLRFHHGSFDGIGRMGVAITDGGRDVVVDFNTWTNIGYYLWDIEPNGATVAGIPAGALDCRFSDNTIGTKPYGDYPDDSSQALGYFFAITGASGGGPAKRISVLRNTMSDGQLRVGIFNNGVDVEDFVMQQNTGSGTFTATGDIGKCVSIASVVNVNVTGNTQTCTVDADFVSLSSCTGTLTTSPNTL